LSSMKAPLAKTAGITDVGLKRERNEDFYSADDNVGLYVVADGMGGHQAGEVASRTAVELINKCYREWSESATPVDFLFGELDSSLSRTGNYILSCIRLANRVVHELAMEHEKYSGMGTTIAVLALVPGKVICANVGDSRIYVARNGQIERLSKDHTIVAEQVEMGMMTNKDAENSHLKHVLTRNLGSAVSVDADIFEIEPTAGDRFILCSDGLTDLLTDYEILYWMIKDDDPNKICSGLLDMALKRGGHDNTTVVSIILSELAKPKVGLVGKVGGFVKDVFSSGKK
jgi:serine/threonine protein phosphatase PrpC